VSAFWGVVRYEYRMAIRRWGMWLAFALAAVPIVGGMEVRAAGPGAVAHIWQAAGTLALGLNFWMPVVGGIVMADRLARDWRVGVHELLASTLLSPRGYVLGKYAGVVLATLTPVLAAELLLAGIACLRGAPAALVPAALVAFLAINLPAYLFVGAFSLACPAVLPVRVYQVLFTGYWFWGNFVNPRAIPSLSETPLAPVGKFVAAAFFRTGLGGQEAAPPYTAAQAVLNLATLILCAAVALAALTGYLKWQARRA